MLGAATSAERQNHISNAISAAARVRKPGAPAAYFEYFAATMFA